MYIYVYIYTYIHTYIHTYIYISPQTTHYTCYHHRSCITHATPKGMLSHWSGQILVQTGGTGVTCCITIPQFLTTPSTCLFPLLQQHPPLAQTFSEIVHILDRKQACYGCKSLKVYLIDSDFSPHPRMSLNVTLSETLPPLGLILFLSHTFSRFFSVSPCLCSSCLRVSATLSRSLVLSLLLARSLSVCPSLFTSSSVPDLEDAKEHESIFAASKT